MAAIYQWFIGDSFLLTSPPYPYEIQDGLQTTFTAPSRTRFVGGRVEDALQHTTAPASVEHVHVLVETFAEDALLTSFTSPARVQFDSDVIVETNIEEALSQLTAPARTVFANGLVTATIEDALITTVTTPTRTTFI